VAVGVTGFASGDAVFGGHMGALAEYLTVKRATLKPANITFEQAAGVAVAGSRALQGLRKARVHAGQQVLITGASGGVGTFAVQIAKALGAEVTGVQSTRNLELVRSLGADHVIDYTREDFTANGAKYDVVFDNVGGHALADVRSVLKPGGTYLPSFGGTPQKNASIANILRMLAISPFLSHRIKFFVAQPTPDDLQALAGMIAAGTVTPVIDTCYAFSDAAEAMRHLESGHTRGKVVVTLP
jgi:NADPH:quinone reductase-like Zn-dependent oxidoreductase